MRKEIVTDNFMGDSKDKFNSNMTSKNIIKYKFKTGTKYMENITAESIIFKEYCEICKDLKYKFDTFNNLYSNMENINNLIYSELHEAKKSNLIKVSYKVNEDTGIEKIMIEPSHVLKKHVSYEYTKTDLKIKFREGTSTSVNSDLIEYVYDIYNKANLYGKELIDKTQIFIDELIYLNKNQLYNNGIDYKLFYKLISYNTILIGIENDFEDYCGIEIYESSLVNLNNIRIYITPTETSKSINYYLNKVNMTEEDISVVRLLLQNYNARHQTNYSLHLSKRFVYMKDENIDEEILNAIDRMKQGIKMFYPNSYGKNYEMNTDNMLILSMDNM